VIAVGKYFVKGKNINAKNTCRSSTIMGRELQKKKNKSSNPKIKQKPKSKRVNPLGNPIIAANW